MSKKVDKGLQLIYWKLTYRRRFIRELRIFPFIIISIGFMVWIGGSIFMNRVAPVIGLVIYIFK
ncbi:hypothetical protein [Clostridium estertheticum]|uniref:hypothetical protein n=1 Tax=Clostridium estertheticum TaxID=238834 RepID=UPI001C0BFE66|nr:hypothetical protein [Clostridium estertheticum]MBU3171916.1 hypothetical protein [Clostridium estertheticum]